MPEPVKITSIDQAEAAMPRYVWIDEDENQVSPIHKEFRSAMNFVNGWSGKYSRLMREAERFEDEESKQIHIERGLHGLTKSGKPPVQLKRVMIEIKIVDPTDEEKRLADVMAESNDQKGNES